VKRTALKKRNDTKLRNQENVKMFKDKIATKLAAIAIDLQKLDMRFETSN